MSARWIGAGRPVRGPSEWSERAASASYLDVAGFGLPVGERRSLDYRVPDLAVFARMAVETALQHAEDDIEFTGDERLTSAAW